MDFSHYNAAALTLTAELVNTFDTGPSGGDHLRTPAGLAQFLRQAGQDVPAGLTDADVAEVAALRERLRAVFHAGQPAAAAPLVNDLVAGAGVVPHLTDHDGTWHVHYAPAGASLARRLQATCGMALMTLLTSGGLGRLKVCDADDCADVLVDTSRNQSRRYCSDRCCNRENVAAFRARRRC